MSFSKQDEIWNTVESLYDEDMADLVSWTITLALATKLFPASSEARTATVFTQLSQILDTTQTAA